MREVQAVGCTESLKNEFQEGFISAGDRARGGIRQRDRPAQPHDLEGDVSRAQYPIDATSFDGVPWHVRKSRGVGSLREDDPTLVLDGLDTNGAIGVAARQHHTNRALGVCGGERLEQRINGEMTIVRGPPGQMKTMVGHRERGIGRDDIDVIGLHDLDVERQADRYCRCLREDLGEQADVVRIEMLDDNPRDAGSRRKHA